MAAEIKPTNKTNNGNVRKPSLVNKIDNVSDDINMAVFIPREDGVITVGDDKYVVKIVFEMSVSVARRTGSRGVSWCHGQNSTDWYELGL